MHHRKLVAGLATLSLVAGGTGVALAAGGSAPKRANVVAIEKVKFKVNRYVQEGLRWQKDTYRVRSGGTLHVVNNAIGAGPHTLTIVKKRDLPRTTKTFNNCAVCNRLGEAHGADPTSDAPPKFAFLENGVGSQAPPSLDRPGDSALLGDKRGDAINLKVTAKKGKQLYVICLIHSWMQAKVTVG
jgi:hypothetical protein